jgi:hypothetical protein
VSKVLCLADGVFSIDRQALEGVHCHEDGAHVCVDETTSEALAYVMEDGALCE